MHGPLNVQNATNLYLRRFLLFYSNLYQHQEVKSNSIKTEFVRYVTLRYQLNNTRNAVLSSFPSFTLPHRPAPPDQLVSDIRVYGLPVIPSILCDECSTMTPLRGSTWPILHTVGTQNRSELLTRIKAPTVVLEHQ